MSYYHGGVRDYDYILHEISFVNLSQMIAYVEPLNKPKDKDDDDGDPTAEGEQEITENDLADYIGFMG